MVIKTDKIPVPGETILGGTFLMNPGGKGANQAVAASRLGGKVTFVAKIGNDLFGNQTTKILKKEGINTSYIVKDPDVPSGIALITVDEEGENSIVVAPGSNHNLLVQDIDSDILTSDKYNVMLIQLEIPLMTVEFAALTAAECGIKVILNPAPAQKLHDYLLRHIWLITPDVIEAEILTGIKIQDIATAEAAAISLQKRGVKNVIITMSAEGAYVKTEDFAEMFPGVKVKAVDTTGAGDVFNAALAVATAEGKGLREAVIFANKAASICVTRMGAQVSAPYRDEIVP